MFNILKMKNRLRLLPVLFLCVMAVSMGSSCGGGGERAAGPNDLKGKITISGAFALYPLTVRWAEEFQKLHPHVTVNVSAGGAGKGMADALSKMVDLGMYSREVSPEEKAKGAWFVAVAKDAVLPTVSSANPVLKEIKMKGLTRQIFAGIFVEGTVKTWGQATACGNREEVQVFTRSDACGAAEMWAKYLGVHKQEDLLGLGMNGDPGIADAVRKNPNSIGYNNLNFVYDIETKKPYAGLEVVPIDLNGNGIVDPDERFYGSITDVMKAIQSGKYPSPPARELYFVSGGKPNSKVVLAFLQWVTGDGQRYLTEAGYVSVSPKRLMESQEALK